MEMILFIGGQAAGKSTFYQQCFRETHLRINLDMLRTRQREAILLEACLRMKQAFVVDNTNPTPEDRQRYIPLARAAVAAGAPARAPAVRRCAPAVPGVAGPDAGAR